MPDSITPPSLDGGDPSHRPVVAMLIYPGFTSVDLIAPQLALSFFMETHIVWRDREPVVSDSGMVITPSATFAECPADVDVLFVPGGTVDQHVHVAARDVLEFLADRGSRARYVTSVCTGSLFLGAAGLLRGYRTGTHWLSRDLLELFGAENVNERVVIDRNRITGGGVTAGLDFALTLIAEMLGDTAARTVQLAMEYDPKPPFDAGSPETAPPEITARLREQTREFDDGFVRVAEELAAKGWGRARADAAAVHG